jgi:hypothetical protein
LGVAPRDRPADAGARAGDQGDAPFKLARHQKALT